MRMQRLETRPASTMALALAVLVIATGLCVFDHHADAGHGHEIVVDLCLGMLAAAIVAAPPMVLTALWTTAYRPLTLAPASLHVLDPPPKRLRRS